MNNNTPWQIKMFNKSLKKKLKVKALLKYLYNKTFEINCLLITYGDNNGTLNYYIRDAGGKWAWAEFEDRNIPEIEQLLDDHVTKLDDSSHLSPFPDNSFDYVVTIDCHEHMKDPMPFMRELYRITRPNGRVLVTVPNGDETKIAVKLKNLIGMTKEVYGHFVVGYDIPDIVKMMKKVGLKPCAYSSYSKFFTEMVELCINFLYVKILSKKGSERSEGEIAPTSEAQLRKLKKSYKIYTIIYPFCLMASQLDNLLFFKTGYAVVVEGRKE